MIVCNKCKNPASIFVYSNKLDIVVCKSCKIATGEYTSGQRGIYDATGKPRDRIWLQDKLEMTSSDKKWEEDIKSRKRMPDGTIRRFKK